MDDVGRLQQALLRTYRIEMPLDVRDFLLSDSEVAIALAPTAAAAREMLLVRQQADALEVSLYLDAADLQALADAGPATAVDDPGLDRFCRIAEGVSHFVLLAWRALRHWPISRFELELQAEVDKFMVCLVAGVGDGPELVEALFVRSRLRDELSATERERYRSASSLARDYCQSLGSKDRDDLLEDARRFYRFGQREKVGHIAGLRARRAA